MRNILIAGLVLVIGAGGYWFFIEGGGQKKSEWSTLDQYAASSTSQREGVAAVSPQEAINQPIPNQNETNKKIMTATLHTNKGDITIEFNPATPNTVENFVKLAQSGFYDGTKFHRVIKGFMSQGGDPFSKDDTKKEMWGRGGPGYAFADEITPSNSNEVNTIAMANAGPNTNGSQFFINAAPNHGLDSKHTVFGKVVAGADVAVMVNSVPTDEYDRPIDPVIITSISLQ